MAKDKTPTYTPEPELPDDPELRKRLTEIVAVLSHKQTMSGAARSLNMSRNHFQTIFHRVLGAMVDAVTPRPPGRPSKPPREAELEAENARLQTELDAMTTRTDAIERMMTLVGGIASGRTPLPRSKSKKTKAKSEDPEPVLTRSQAVAAMRELGTTTEVCAAILGVSTSTVLRATKPVERAPKPTRPYDETRCAHVRSLVRDTHGLVGAQSLGVAAGLPRRVCAEIKRRELV